MMYRVSNGTHPYEREMVIEFWVTMREKKMLTPPPPAYLLGSSFPIRPPPRVSTLIDIEMFLPLSRSPDTTSICNLPCMLSLPQLHVSILLFVYIPQYSSLATEFLVILFNRI
jgi:hypothetical protein